MSRNEAWDVFRRWRKVYRDGAKGTLSGRLFQMVGPSIVVKASKITWYRCSISESCVTISRHVSCCRQATCKNVQTKTFHKQLICMTIYWISSTHHTRINNECQSAVKGLLHWIRYDNGRHVFMGTLKSKNWTNLVHGTKEEKSNQNETCSIADGL